MLMARQPIFTRDGKVFGYKLLYRETELNMYLGSDVNVATSSVISGQFFSHDVMPVIGEKKAMVNFTYNTLTMDIATLLPHENLVVEVLEEDMLCPEILEACQRLKSFGYTLSFGSFVLHSSHEAFLQLADIIRVDFLTFPDSEKKALIHRFKGKPVAFLAEKIESREDFDKAAAMGYTYFQGYFFAQPVIHHLKTIPSSQLSRIRLMNEINAKEIDFQRLTEIIEMDTAFSYELLKIVNSAFFSRGNKISSIRQALVRLGISEIRKWSYITLLKGNNDDSHHEAANFSMIRAKFMERFAEITGQKKMSGEFMTVGILSLLDVVMECPMELLMNEMPLSDDVKSVLLRQPGDTLLHKAFRLIEDIERGSWKEVSENAATLGIRMEQVADLHHEAIKWLVDFESEWLNR